MNLEQTCSLTEIISNAAKAFELKQLRSLQFEFSPGNYFEIEYTDARTNRFRYNHFDHNVRVVKCYYENEQLFDSLNDIFRDVKVMIRLLPDGTQDPTLKLKINLFEPTKPLPIVYVSEPGCLIYHLR